MATSGQNDGVIQVQVYPIDPLFRGLPIFNDSQFGSAATAYVLDVDPAAYTLTFPDVDLVYAPAATVYELNVNPAAYTITFASVQLLLNRQLDVNPASYALSFPNVDLVYAPGATSYVLDVNPVSYQITFPPVDLAYSGAAVGGGFFTKQGAAVAFKELSEYEVARTKRVEWERRTARRQKMAMMAVAAYLQKKRAS